MAFPAKKKKIRNLSDDVDISFYQPKPVLKKYGYTQAQLAEELGASPSSIHGIINGNPSVAQIKLVAETIGASFFEFFSSPSAATHTNLTCPSCGATLAADIKLTRQ